MSQKELNSGMSLAELEAARCNRFASTCHLVECIIIAIAYILEFVKGARDLPYIIITILLALVVPITCKIIIASNPCAKIVRHLISFGFGAFYIFICMTTNNKLAFVYILPLLVAILVYNDYRYTAISSILCWIVNIIQVIVFLNNGTYVWATDSAEIEIQILAMLIITVFMILAVRLSAKNSRARVDQIEEQAAQAQENMNNTMSISASMIGNIETVTEKMDQLNQATLTTKDSMGEVNTGASSTSEAIQRQLELTDNIQNQVSNVQQGTAQILTSISEANSAVENGKQNITTLISQVEDSVASGNEVNKELETLKSDMANIHSVVEIIQSITSQTSLLALNASIEAARAGESGRGFAVVASEISKMASETDDATTQIQTMLESFTSTITKVVSVTSDMIQKINAQLETSETAASSFGEIESSTSVIIENANALDTEVKDLSDANREIIDSISTISAISEQVAAHANNTYEISEENAQTVSDISDLINQISELASKLK